MRPRRLLVRHFLQIVGRIIAVTPPFASAIECTVYEMADLGGRGGLRTNAPPHLERLGRSTSC